MFRNRRQNAEGNHRPRSIHDEDQDHRPTRAKVLRLDRWFHPRLSLDLPADVDLQARVRRVRTLDRPPKVLLRSSFKAENLNHPRRCYFYVILFLHVIRRAFLILIC
jgi:hypothetical protein